MSNTDIEIVVDDPTAPEADSPAVTSNRAVDVVVRCCCWRWRLTLGYRQLAHRRRLGFDRPAARLFPVLSLASSSPAPASTAWSPLPVAQGGSRDLRHAAQLRRVWRCSCRRCCSVSLTQFLGLYVASFLLIAGFMRLVGKIALWKSLLTAFVFTAIMFVTFDIAFDVIMPKGRSKRPRPLGSPPWKPSACCCTASPSC